VDVDATLDRITHSAAEAIPGIDHASISVTPKAAGSKRWRRPTR